VGSDVPIDSETLLMTDFVNFKIKPTQSFGGAHRSTMCVCVFIGVTARIYMSIYVCTCRHPEDRVPYIQALSQDNEQCVHSNAVT
jgi:hypothetical protein